MADTDNNVTALRPKAKDTTGALRAKRLRRKRKTRSTVTARRQNGEISTVEKTNDFNANVTVSASPIEPPNKRNGVTLATTAAALSLAAVSAGFSITGMTAVFVGAFWPVIGMGVALELGKLSAVAWLGHHGGTASWRLRAALSVLVIILIALNAIGAYGFLARAHIGHAVDGDSAMASKAADVDARMLVEAGVVADLDRRIAQIDGAIEKATERGRTRSAMQLAEDHRKARADLAGKRIAEAKTLAGLQVEKAAIEGERAKVAADLGPIRYLATLLGAGDQDVLRWFILVVAMLLDPAAVLLLLAAASARRAA